MVLDEQLALQMAKVRIDEAVRAAEQRRAVRAARPHRSVRARLGSALAWLGHWMRD